MGALRRRFEPDSKKELYLAKFQNRHKRIGEDWATFAEQLRTLSYKAYPTLGVEAKEVLALNRYLGEIEDPQISFGVKQTRPKNLDEAVATTLEMESYVKNQPGTKTVRFDEDSSTVIAGVRSTNEAMMQMMSQVMERLEKLEMNQTRSQERHHKRQSTPPSSPVICRRCGGEGHYARGCASRVKYQGNEKPSKLTILPVNPVSAYSVSGQINGHEIYLVVDTGAAVTLMRKSLWDRVKPQESRLLPWAGGELTGVEGTTLQVQGTAKVSVQISEHSFQVEFVIVDGLSEEAILGLDFLSSHQCSLDIGKKTLFISDSRSTVPLQTHPQSRPDSNPVACVVMSETRQIPPYSELEVMASVPERPVGTCIVEGLQSRPVLVARALVEPAEGKVPIRLMNPHSEPITVYQGSKVANLEMTEDDSFLPVHMAAVTAKETNPDKQAVLWDMVCKVDPTLSEPEKNELFSLLLEYSDVFADHEKDVGHTTSVTHKINTGESPPIRQPMRRITPSKKEETRKLIQEMKDGGIIRPSSSPWSSPVILVKKKNGTTRFCIDYRRVNAVTRKDAYPLPRVDDTLDTLSGSAWFTTLDLVSGYWQIEVDPNDREKTAFATTESHFEFNRMPFWLCNAPSTFQCLMDLVLAGLQWDSCLVYLDDVIIPGRSLSEHLQNLSAVLDRLRKAGLKLQPPKCVLCRKEVTFLGHIVSEQGIATDPAKTEILAYPNKPTGGATVSRTGELLSPVHSRFRHNCKAPSSTH